MSPERRVGDAEDPGERWRAYGLLLIALVAIASAGRFRLYPVFVDSYYHMAVIEGFDRAGGIVARAFWEMAPGGKPHLYPPALHAAGHLVGLFGLSARSLVTFLSWASYPLSVLTLWLWLREVAGPRAAFFGAALLLGPGAWFWNQTVHTANALVMVVMPLALLALERERFLACAAANFAAVAAHPMGLCLPPALLANALLRKKRMLAGVAAAAAPAVLYLPWLAHVWANRAFFSPVRLGRVVELERSGFHVGVIALGLAGALWKRREALGVLGPLVGFGLAVPLGFGGRFSVCTIHWPLAALGALGAAGFLEALERRPKTRSLAALASAPFAFFVLVAHPALHVRSGAPEEAKPERPAGGLERAPGSAPFRLYATLRPSLLVRLLDYSTRPDPLSGLGPVRAFKPFEPERLESSAVGSRGDGKPHAAPPRLSPDEVDLIHRPGARAFFQVVRREVPERAVVFAEDPVLAAFLSGAAGRPASSGLLRDVLSYEAPAGLEDCEFAVTIPATRRLFRVREPLSGFQRIFRNAFGSLWKNERPPGRKVEVPPPVLPTGLLALLAAVLLATAAVDLAGPAALRRSPFIPLLAFAAVAACMAPVGAHALAELRCAPRPAPDAAAPRVPPAMPLELSLAYHRLQRLLDAEAFWTPEDEARLFELVEAGRFDRALRLVDDALRAASTC